MLKSDEFNYNLNLLYIFLNNKMGNKGNFGKKVKSINQLKIVK